MATRGGLIVFFIWIGATSLALADGPLRGQSLFLPVFSEVPYGSRGATVPLSATVSIRNLDADEEIRLLRVDYIDGGGRVVRRYLDAPRIIAPMAASTFFLPESDRSGGSSAGFALEWSSVKPARPPLVESVMVNGAYNQSLAFRTEARALESRP